MTLKLIAQVAAAPPAEVRRARTPKTDGTQAEDVAAVASAISILPCIPPSEMMLHVRHIIVAMTEYSGAAAHVAAGEPDRRRIEAPVAGSPASKIPLVSHLILGIIRALPPALHGELSMLPPFPAHPQFAELNGVYKALSRERTLAEEIIW